MRFRTPAITPLAAALSLSLSCNALAEPVVDASSRTARDLDSVEVQGQRATMPSSVKYTGTLLDTPQSITVVTGKVLSEQNLLSLRDALTTLPGITFGAGEGGGGYGDSITLRGFNASSDITTDGVRDSAQYSRTDTFNIESLELVNGANSVYSGAGSVGGNINLVSKHARTGDFMFLQGGAGTDGYGRITFDGNEDLDNGTALRLNAMAHRNDAPGRDVEKFERWGVAPSVAFGLDSDTRFTLSYLHQSDDNIPQYGVPYYSAFGGPLPGAARENYYGYANFDRQKIDVDMLTGVFEHDLGETSTLRSLARFQQVDQLSVVDAPQGTWCLETGINPANGQSCSTPDSFTPSGGPRGHSRDTRNAIAISQTDLTTFFHTGVIEHALVAGVSFSRESFDLTSRSLFRNVDGSPLILPTTSISNPDATYTGLVNPTLIGRTQGTLANQAAYVFDTLKFGEKWMLNLGARFEHNDGDSVVWNVKTYTAPTATNPKPDNSNIGSVISIPAAVNNTDNLFSYRAGVVFKPVSNGSVYLSYSNSKSPSKSSVNGTCNAATDSTTAAGTVNCNVDPETAINYELGTKWDLLGSKLSVSAAVFRNDRENFKVADPGNPGNPTGEQQLDGEARVDGVTLGVAGHITHEWSIFANATWLDSEVLQGVSDNCQANPQPKCLNTTANPDPLKGRPISGTPERAGSLWTTYELERWTFGYGITYQSGYTYYTSSSTNLLNNLGDIKGYTTHRAMVSYQANDHLSLQLNANNLFDKAYYIRVRNNGWATPGDARNVVLSATYKF